MKSLEYVEVFTAALCDVQTLHSNVYTTSDLDKDLQLVQRRFIEEGIGFLTKTLPRLGKLLDKVLANQGTLDAAPLGFKAQENSKLPLFCGKLFERILDSNGAVLLLTDAACVRSLRMLLYLFYKLELPYDPKLEQNVIEQFKKTEDELLPFNLAFLRMSQGMDEVADHFVAANNNGTSDTRFSAADIRKNEFLYGPDWFQATIRGARKRLSNLFSEFNHRDIYPKHGPGAVSTKEQLSGKYVWRKVSRRITDSYPFDEYFLASGGHLCDRLQDLRWSSLDDGEDMAKVVLVPKDSRGPRLISCEPLAFQWIQQGLAQAVMRHVEHSPLTKESVRFTNQEPNGMAALYGSYTGLYATLDLQEASDRVTIGIVSLLFPEPLRGALMDCRSLGTRLPDGQELILQKYAPMGSALCFPVLALTIWSLLDAGLEALNTDWKPGKDLVYVYGDDVIVPTAKAEHAMTILESFGLKINRSKSCTSGFFRESCGVDAFKGLNVTPVRIRTPWSTSRCPESYVSWIAYANSFWDKKYYGTYNYIVEKLADLYKVIPSRDLGVTELSVPLVPVNTRKPRRRWNSDLQKAEYQVYDVVPESVNQVIDGWSMLLRYFAEACSSYELARNSSSGETPLGQWFEYHEPFSVRVYTKRKRSNLRMCWR